VLRELAQAEVLPPFLDFVNLSLTTALVEMRSRFADELGFDSVVAETSWGEALALRLKEQGPGLLLLDHAEGVAQDLGQLCSILLAAAPGLVIVVGSQRRLESGQEQVLELAPLEVPDDSCCTMDGLLASESGCFLMERLRRLNLGFDPSEDEIRSLCTIAIGLEGVPLSLELAAGRLAVMRPDELSVHLQHSTAVVTSGRRRDHHFDTLRVSIEAALEAAAESERAVLAQATVFAGGFDATAARTIIKVPGSEADEMAVLDVLESLWSRSLLFRETGPNGQLRLSLLRSVSQVLTESPEYSALVAKAGVRQIQYFASFGHQHSDSFRFDGSALAIRTLQRERENLTRAFESTHGQAHFAAQRAMLALGLSTAERGRVPFKELQQRLDECQRKLDGVPGAEALRARLLCDAASCCEKAHGSREAYPLFEQAGDLAAAHGERRLECLTFLRRSSSAWNLGQTVRAAADLRRATDLLIVEDHYMNALAFRASEHVRSHGYGRVDWQAIWERLKHFSEHEAWSAYINLALSRTRNLMLGDAFEMLTAARGFALERGLPAMLGFVERYRANLLLELGREDEAAELVDLYESMDRTFELRHGAYQLLCVKGYLTARRGDLAKAVNLLRRALTEVSKTEMTGLVYQSCCTDYAITLWVAEGPDAVDRFLASTPDLIAPRLFAVAGGVCLLAGRTDAAKVLLEIASSCPTGGEEQAIVTTINEFARCTLEDGTESAASLIATLARREWDAVGLDFPRGSLTTSVGLVIFALAQSLGGEQSRRVWAELWTTADALLVKEDGTAFRLPTGEWFDLSKRKQLTRLLLGLALRAQQEGEPLTADEVQELLWPGERMLATAATNRIYKAISLLRGVGLGDLVQGGDGYRLDETVTVRIVSLDGPLG